MMGWKNWEFGWFLVVTNFDILSQLYYYFSLYCFDVGNKFIFIDAFRVLFWKLHKSCFVIVELIYYYMHYIPSAKKHKILNWLPKKG
jgi:hypothetical protein